MESITQFPKATRLAIEILEEYGPLSMQSFSGRFIWLGRNGRRESNVFEMQCLLTMEKDGLVEQKKAETGHTRFHLTDKARELMSSGKI